MLQNHRVDYLFGLARNTRLTAELEPEMTEARAKAEKTGQPARRFRDFTWSTLESWSRTRRVIGKQNGPAGRPIALCCDLTQCGRSRGMASLRRIGLPHTRFANATCSSIRLRLLKIGALVRLSASVTEVTPRPNRKNSSARG